MNLPIYQVDAFTGTLFEGNPAAVCPLSSWLPNDLMQTIALENNLSETAFFVKEGDRYHIRWFTPEVEIALCGHATVATAHVMAQHLGIKDQVVRFTCLSGEIAVKLEKKLYVLDFPSRQLEPSAPPKDLYESIGRIPFQLLRANEDYLLVFENEEQIKTLEPNWSELVKVKARGIIVTAQGSESDFVSRFFAPAVGINEDPVTGSAHTALVPYWAKRLGKNKLFAKQLSKRGGLLYCEHKGERTEIGGEAVTYMQGSISV